MRAALVRWPFCTARTIATPFSGFGIRAPDPDGEAESDEEYERLLELPYAVRCGLAEFSRDFTDVAFVFIDADCVGGTCIYTGFVARAGVVVEQVTENATGTGQLERLLKPLGVQLRSGNFAPFARGYWDYAEPGAAADTGV